MSTDDLVKEVLFEHELHVSQDDLTMLPDQSEQIVHLNTDTGQLEVSIGNTRYGIVPGSAAEKDIQGILSSQSSESGSQVPLDNHRNQIQRIIGSRLDGSSEGPSDQDNLETFLSSNVISSSEGLLMPDTSELVTDLVSENNDVFKKPAIPIRFQSSTKFSNPSSTSSHVAADFNKIVKDVATVFADGDEDFDDEEDDDKTEEDEVVQEFEFAAERVPDPPDPPPAPTTRFTCEICNQLVDCQKEFFIHLKSHYEPHREQQSPVDLDKFCKPCKRYFLSTKQGSQDPDVATDPATPSHPVPKLNGIKKHQCNQCPDQKSFSSKSALHVHQRIHSDTRPFRCSLCPKSFRQRSDLRYHEQSLHSSRKEFQCEYCSKQFARKYSLNIHRKIHTGERNHVCDICSKGFRTAIYLKNHRRTHTGEKPYPCEICGKSFRIRADMNRHKSLIHAPGSTARKKKIVSPKTMKKTKKKMKKTSRRA